MGHVDIDIKNAVEEQFEFKSSLKKGIITVGVVGVALFVLGLVIAMFGGHGHEEAHHAVEGAAEAHAAVADHAAEGEHHGPSLFTRVLSAIWYNNLYFLGLGIIGVFFFALQFVANAGWSVPFLRIMLRFGRFLPISLGVLLVTFLIGSHDLFHWTHDYLWADPTADTFDPIIAGKRLYLNTPFYIGRIVFIGAGWLFFMWMLKKVTLDEDNQPQGTTLNFRKLQRLGVAFLIFFGVSESISSWDWYMSIDPHWFSTLYGWYILSAYLASGMAALMLVTMKLKDWGYLKIVNENHVHDIGKFLFGFSIFWAYLWFAQFLLIYYANIPEETIYFVDRLMSDKYSWLIFTTLIFNFLMPFFVLMTRDAKRKFGIAQVAAVLVLVGHWLEFYLLITPGVMKEAGSLGFIEIGLGVIFFAAFVFVFFQGLAKHKLVAKNHPMLEEAIHHHC
ncbi:quinol:cytochrome C oxidoreductase [Sediminitomix flava]|uniref:Quinol:cytochrome c oxidoreductase quinone-binding subunit 2 n=1 Tax=Sediminitomix flava TaxID=379075 RepID=A0A315ZC04_SEDFL|nr:quinol:cytochrome C oxidoreductase [Sediminitomix flava]PWJ43106.1 quinol:cytochrome c oxidoreductase quinone-binding subunit 2 [Sediminitomix flava]